MKRITALLISALMMFGIIGTSVFATADDAEAVAISVETTDAINGGKDIQVKVFVSREPHWGGLSLTIQFDPSKLTYKEFEVNDDLLMQIASGKSFMIENTNLKDEGKIGYTVETVASDGGYEGYYSESDHLLILHFDVAAECEDGISEISVFANKCCVATGNGYEVVSVKTKCTSGGINVMNDYCDVYGHKWGKWNTVKDATCSTPGIEERVCLLNPAHKETREVPMGIPGDMDSDEDITVADALMVLRIAAKLADETKESLDIGDMDGDKRITVADALAILRIAAKLAPKEIKDNLHDWGEWTVIKEPNCSEEGVEERVCKLNGEHKQIRNVPKSANAHVWGEWHVIKEANCTEKGKEERICVNNPTHKQTRDTPVNPDVHNFYLAGHQTPWCTLEGYDVYVCRRCEYEKWIYYPKAEHNWIQIGGQAPTETEDGFARYMCLDCFEEKTEILPKTGN